MSLISKFENETRAVLELLKTYGDSLLDKNLVKKLATGRLKKEDIAFRLIPAFTLEVIRRYLRVETEGMEHVPKTGGGIIISNHSGYAGFDALMIRNEVERAIDRRAHLLAHKLWFFGKPVRVVSEKMGLVEADINESLKILRRDDLLILFPEGEAGNFKPTNRRYRLQEFKRGFIRLAMITGKPIIPSMVIGAEETHINLSQIQFTKYLIGSVIPLPLNVLPLPVKWKIKFLPPITTDHFSPADAMNREKVRKMSLEIRRHLQREIVAELRRRENIQEDYLSDVKFNAEDEPGL